MKVVWRKNGVDVQITMLPDPIVYKMQPVWVYILEIFAIFGNQFFLICRRVHSWVFNSQRLSGQNVSRSPK